MFFGSPHWASFFSQRLPQQIVKQENVSMQYFVMFLSNHMFSCMVWRICLDNTVIHRYYRLHWSIIMQTFLDQLLKSYIKFTILILSYLIIQLMSFYTYPKTIFNKKMCKKYFLYKKNNNKKARNGFSNRFKADFKGFKRFRSYF